MNVIVQTPKPLTGLGLSVKFHGNMPPNTMLKKVRGYGHQVATDLFRLDVRITGDNFNHVDFYDDVGGWSAVSKFYSDVQDILPWLRGQHPQWTSSMEAWMIGDVSGGGTPDRPMWWDVKNGQRVLRCGTSVFGENVVLVEARNGQPVEYVLYTNYPATPNKIEPIAFYRVIGMRKADMAVVSHQSHPWWVQRCNQANSKPTPNYIDWYPKGTTIYYPVLDYQDWMPNTKAGAMLLPKAMVY